MLRALTIVLLLAGPAAAQNATRPSLDEQLADAGRLLEGGRLGDYERLLRRLIPKPEDGPVQATQISSPNGLYSILWAQLASSYLGANDYAAAERVAGERLRAAETASGTAAYPAQLFLSLMAEIYRLQSKHADAFPLYQRLVLLNERLSADFQLRAELGYAECLMVRGESAAAETVSRPPVDPDGSWVGPSFHEDIFNTHAVAMEEAGHEAEAAELEARIDAQSRRTAPVNRQDRDLLRARLSSARKRDAAAEAIYRKWTAYWKTSNVPGIVDPRESLRIRTAALVGYGHLLSVRGRSREAQAIQSQLTAMGCRFGSCQ
jgi:hypothetical protein